MIKRYVYGKVIETDAVLQKPKAEGGEIEFFTADEKEKTFSFEMKPTDRIYGLGEAVRGINKRGWIYESRCSDNPNHGEDSRSLYGAHNFFAVDGEEKFGMFLDYPGRAVYDVGYTKKSEFKIKVSDWNLDVHIITGDSMKDIVKEFRALIGRSYIPPLWGFGYGQSRWSYMSADEVREVVKKHRSSGIPIDSVYLDIDYMKDYKDFTVDGERFPDFEGFCREMKEENIHLVPIIDAGIKQEKGYSVYDEGLKKGYFCKKEDGSIFVAAVWPGKAVFADVLNKDARRWFGEQYRTLIEKGADGFWNDMNEPAIFYTEERFKNVLKEIGELRDRDADIETFNRLNEKVGGLSNNEEDYKMFVHDIDGVKVRHDRVHNLFGYNMTRAASEAFERICPDKRVLLFSRASCIGMHRCGGIWQGDNKSWWSHLLMNIKMMPSLNMCGFLYTGADLGGFGSDVTEELLLRWLAFGIFTPLMRNHSAWGTRRQEAYLFEDIAAFRHIIGLRYRLLPYIYSEYMKAALRNEMMFRPLAFDYPSDCMAARVEDQLLLGSEIMIAPVYEENARGRYVYLPEKMKMVRFTVNGEETAVLEKGHHYIEYALTDVVIFIRPGCLIPLSGGGQSTEDVDFENLTYYAFEEDGRASYEYYHDDGIGKKYEEPGNIRILKSGEI